MKNILTKFLKHTRVGEDLRVATKLRAKQKYMAYFFKYLKKYMAFLLIVVGKSL